MQVLTTSRVLRAVLGAAIIALVACSRGSDRTGTEPGDAAGSHPPAGLARAGTGFGTGAPANDIVPASVKGAVPAESAALASGGATEHRESAPGVSTHAVEATPASASSSGERAKEPIPLAPMGKMPSKSALVNSPGYTPPDDPEWESALTGRRNVGPVAMQLSGGYPSGEALAEALLDAVNRDDVKGLHALRMTYEEFETILWPEFPQSRPVTNIGAQDAWEFYMQTSLSGASRGVHEWSGRDLRLERLSYSIGLAPYTNFNLYRGVVIHARAGDGEHVELTFAFTFLERNGRWKVYIYKD